MLLSFQTGAWAVVRSQSVHLRLLSSGMTQLALFHDQTMDSTQSGQVLLPQELSQVRGKLDVSLQVGFVRTSNDTRNDVLRMAQRECFRVVTHTPCIHSSGSISLGLPRLRRQV